MFHLYGDFLYVFRGADNQNECQGRLGFALLQQSNNSGAAKLILYRTKSQIMSSTELAVNKSLTFKQDYLQYTDDSNIFWSLNFTSTDEADVFLQELDQKCKVTRVNSTEIAAEAIKIETELSEAAAETDGETNDTNDTTTDASRKSNLVQRMAKVGQALPMLDATNNANAIDTDSSFSSCGGGDSDNTTSLILSSVPSHSHPKPTNISVAVQPVPNYWHPSSAAANYSSSNLNNFVSENRMQNTEVRMNLSKLDSKLDRVLDQIEMLKLSGGRSTVRNAAIDYEEEMIKLEEKIVELKKENRLYKLKLAEAENKVPSVTSSGNEELTALKEQFEAANKDLAKFRQEQSAKEAVIEELNGKLNEETEKANASAHAKRELETTVEQLEGKLKAEIELNKSMEDNARDFNKSSADLAKQLKEAQEKVAEYQKNGQTAQNKSHETIRSIMNKLYVELFQSVNGRDTMSSAEVLKLTAELIRRETKAALNQTT